MWPLRELLMSRFKFLVARAVLGVLNITAAVVLTACGGGGGGSDPTPPPGGSPVNVAPVANAGTAQSVAVGAQVTLSGSASSDANGDALSYAWTLTSKPVGSAAVLTGATTVTASFKVDVAGPYIASLVVSDGKLSSPAVSVTVTSAAANVAPVANAGPNQNALVGAVVKLDGRGSSDANGDALVYTWVLVKPPASAATLIDAKTATPSFTPDVVGTYAAGLVVSDGKLNSAATSVVVNVTAASVGPFTVSGSVVASNVSTVDSDTNDPNQVGRASNNTLATAQPSGNPGLVVGYVNQPSTGPRGVNYTAGDISDIYLVAGQVVELNFGDDDAADLDLKIYDSAGNLVGKSTGVSRSECVLVRRTGSYYIQVFAFDGASTYELAWAAPRPSSTCANVTPTSATEAAFVAGEIVGKAVASAGTSTNAGAATSSAQQINPSATSLLQSAGIQVKAAAWDAPMLLSLPSNRAQRAQSLRALQAGDRVRARALSAKASASIGATGTAPTPNREAPADLSETARLAFDTVVAAKLLQQSGQFAYAELNWVLEATQVRSGTWPPNDTDVSRQPHLDLIKLPQAFAAFSSLSPASTYTPIVAVIDTGVVTNHPELQRMLVPGYDFVSNTTSAGDGGGIDSDANDATPAGQNAVFHGTHVAGTVAAETFNGLGMAGVAPMARIMPVRVLGVTGSGAFYDILQGVRFAAGLTNDSGTLPARRADVINLSLGGAGACPAAVADVMASARAQGVIVVAAAGNEKRAPVGFPANCAGVIAVSAIAYDGSLASYSNVGPEVAVTAPGGDASKASPAGRDEIWSLSATFVADAAGVLTRRPGYRALQGTSMATPHVAGVLALMRAVNPALTPANVDALLAAGSLTDEVGAAGRDIEFGFGRINAQKAVQAAGGAAPAPTPSLQVSPAQLDFGATLTELTVTFRRVNGSTDTPTTFTSSSLNPQAVRVFIPTGGNPTAGPFNFLVRVDRTLLAPSETVVRVQFNTTAGAKLPFDVLTAPRPVLSGSQRGVGPLYVLAIDADNTTKAVAEALSQSTTANYAYTITGLKIPRVIITAGTDLDNDGFICGAAEPCSAYPTLGSPTVLSMTGNRTRIDFDLSSGTTKGASLSTGSIGPQGVPRLRLQDPSKDAPKDAPQNTPQDTPQDKQR
jgi:serine protease